MNKIISFLIFKWGWLWIQKICPHKTFSYDSDTDVTYCDFCGESLMCGDLIEELFHDACGYPEEEFDSDWDDSGDIDY